MYIIYYSLKRQYVQWYAPHFTPYPIFLRLFYDARHVFEIIKLPMLFEYKKEYNAKQFLLPIWTICSVFHYDNINILCLAYGYKTLKMYIMEIAALKKLFFGPHSNLNRKKKIRRKWQFPSRKAARHFKGGRLFCYNGIPYICHIWSRDLGQFCPPHFLTA
jgi:hypothetical protein